MEHSKLSQAARIRELDESSFRGLVACYVRMGAKKRLSAEQRETLREVSRIRPDRELRGIVKDLAKSDSQDRMLSRWEGAVRKKRAKMTLTAIRAAN